MCAGPDIVLFINGLAVVVIELKRSLGGCNGQRHPPADQQPGGDLSTRGFFATVATGAGGQRL